MSAPFGLGFRPDPACQARGELFQERGQGEEDVAVGRHTQLADELLPFEENGDGGRGGGGKGHEHLRGYVAS